MNRTSIVLKSVLRFELDKGQYFDHENFLYPILFPKIKRLMDDDS